jgi:hypothetical protein
MSSSSARRSSRLQIVVSIDDSDAASQSKLVACAQVAATSGRHHAMDRIALQTVGFIGVSPFAKDTT